MKPKVLFVGNLLSKTRGTKGISEKIALLLHEFVEIRLVSSIENQILRMVDIILAVLLSSYDIINIDVYSGRGFYYANYASFVAKFRKKKLVMTLRGGMLAEKYTLHPKLLRKVFSRADVLQSPSEFLTTFFRKESLEVNCLPNFIDLKKFPYNRQRIEPFSLLWVRAFSSEYHPELALHTLHKLIKKHPATRLTMIGPDNGLLAKMKILMHDLNIESCVDIIGRIPNDELYQYYQNHAVYLNTTEYESFGVAVLEAASCGIPIVSTSVGEIPYMWEDGKEILMVKEMVAEEIVEKVESIFDSNDFSGYLSKNAREKSNNYGWENVKKQWLDILKTEDKT